MIEVYPHPAIVSLFDLPISLKYKAKRGRSLASRKAEFARLFGHLESLELANPQLRLTDSPLWLQLRSEVRDASTGVALDRTEDEGDAYVCAYIGMYYRSWGNERCRVVGALQVGYIVTPVDADAVSRLERIGP